MSLFRRVSACLGPFLLLASIHPLAAGEEKQEHGRYRGGGVRFAAFFVTNIDTTLQLDVEGLPIGGRVDFTDDLGIRDSVTVPKINPKLDVLVGSNLFLIEYGEYKGSFVTAGVAVEYEAFKHVGFGGSLERLSMDLEIDDSAAYWDFNHLFTGYSAYIAIYF